MELVESSTGGAFDDAAMAAVVASDDALHTRLAELAAHEAAVRAGIKSAHSAMQAADRVRML